VKKLSSNIDYVGTASDCTFILNGAPFIHATLANNVLVESLNNLDLPEKSEVARRLTEYYEKNHCQASASFNRRFYDSALRCSLGEVAHCFDTVKRGRKQKLQQSDIERLPEEYDALIQVVRGIKKDYKDERKRHEKINSRRGFREEDWEKAWLNYGRDTYESLLGDKPDEFLILFTDPYKPASSPSGIAYIILARKYGLSHEYIKKIIGGERKARKATKLFGKKRGT
jgi:hypothetical protein